MECMATSKASEVATRSNKATKILPICFNIRMICGIRLQSVHSIPLHWNKIRQLQILAIQLNQKKTLLQLKRIGCDKFLIIIRWMKKSDRNEHEPNNHLSQGLCTHSRHDSLHQFGQYNLSKRISGSSHKKVVDIDKLIGDVKITPTKINNYLKHVENIKKELQCLKEHPLILDQVKTIELLLNSLTKKISVDQIIHSRIKNSHNSHQKENSRATHKAENVSPIRNFQRQGEEFNSQIIYTNFSIKGLNKFKNSVEEAQEPQQSVLEFQELQTPLKRSLFAEEHTEEIQRLNKEILMLDRALKSKGVQQVSSIKKKLGSFQTFDLRGKEIESSTRKRKYMESQNLCPSYRKPPLQERSETGFNPYSVVNASNKKTRFR